MSNVKLNRAKKAKNDEFYTQYKDIENEISAYIEYDPDVFRGKTILCPCDDPEKSNFTKYFIDNFDNFGLKKLICSCIADRDETFGRCFFMSENGERDYQFLNGNGDFRSAEVTAFRDKADVIITNPPFSLFREFFDWEKEKEFITVGNLNGGTYTNVFPSIMEGDIWFGNGKKFNFITENDYFKMQNVRWYTNLMYVPKNPLPTLMTMEENLKKSKHKVIREKGYPKYDNYDAIEVSYVDAIPCDYDGIMGVPITYLDYNFSGLFEIVGRHEDMDKYKLKTKKYAAEEEKTAKTRLNCHAVIKEGTDYTATYNRIFIKQKVKFNIMGVTESEFKGASNGIYDNSSKNLQPTINGEKIYKRVFIEKGTTSTAG